jgi:hypothetical protein
METDGTLSAITSVAARVTRFRNGVVIPLLVAATATGLVAWIGLGLSAVGAAKLFFALAIAAYAAGSALANRLIRRRRARWVDEAARVHGVSPEIVDESVNWS